MANGESGRRRTPSVFELQIVRSDFHDLSHGREPVAVKFDRSCLIRRAFWAQENARRCFVCYFDCRYTVAMRLLALLRSAAAVVLLPLLVVQPAFAWGLDGHMMVNRLAGEALPK